MDMRLEGLSIDDMIWMIFDGGEVLPRDPATLILELTGKGNWFVDITDPEAVAEFEENPRAPGDIQALSLNRLLLTVAGAELNGTGDFTFDSSDLATFDGMPRPEGSATFNLIGANGLLDKLVQMGILPEDQAMGARMMMGIFARPGNGEDTLTSTIEVNSEGAVLANGQRLR
jgi:hypothetical protein